MSEPVVVARGLARRFGTKLAVDSLDLTVPPGTVYGLLGPNGSGKTTAMRMLTGLLSPSAGSAEVLGFTLPGAASRLKRRIGYMTQGFSLYRDLTVRENLRFVAAVYGLYGKAARLRIDELLETYALRDSAAMLAGEMSGGQRQRLALAATIMHKPKLLFLDEPTAAVDPESRREFWEHLFDLIDEGASMIVSTHLMDEAERCHRIAILDRGRKCADGLTRDLLDGIGQRAIEVAAPDLRAARRALSNRPGVLSIAHIGARLRILVAEDDANALENVRAILHGHADATATPTRPNLEDVFVLATRKADA